MPIKSFTGDDQTLATADDEGTLPPVHGRERPSMGAYAQVAALLHESRRQAPDQIGSFLARRVAEFGMRELSVYVTDFEQRRLVPIAGSAATASIGMDDSAGGRSFTRAKQVDETTADGVRLWSVVVDGAARLGVMSVTMSEVYGDGRALADSLAGVVAALLITRGQCTDAYTSLRRSKKFSLAAEMQWDLLPPLSLDSGRVSVAGLIQPAYEVGGDSFDYAVNGDILDFAVFDAMGHGLVSSQLAHLAVSSYRHSRRSGLDLEATYEAMDDAVAARSRGDEFVTCILGRINLLDGQLTWINIGHPLPLLVRGGEVLGPLPCEPTLPAGLGSDELGRCVAEVAHAVLQPGDRLFCVTDGVVDAHRPGGEDFGRERLVALLRDRSRAGLDAAETVRQLSHTVLDHHGVLSDDTTAFLVDFH
ncbi:MAG TPA: PP2C family protein-serine/threonine phosphatase [Acidimicrobiales bacterium]|nr:PP2C family protein-serine/threonine phosphatase [Acidimicrobiales bacterium]